MATLFRCKGPVGALMAVVALGFGLGGCALKPTAPGPTPAWLSPRLEPAQATPRLPVPDATTLLAPSPAMLRFVADEGLAGGAGRDPRRRLIDAMMRAPGPDGQRALWLDYDSRQTRTAAEAFEARAGNCLSLVLMTASLARELGLAVSYQTVHTEGLVSRSGKLTLVSGHVNLVLGPRPMREAGSGFGRDGLVIDFLPPQDLRGQRSTEIGEATLKALYFNNRAAELLAEDRVADAWAHAHEALRQDASLLAAVNTLGVVLGRAGHAEAAEAAYRHVLQHEPDSTVTLANLVALLQSQSRHAEAGSLAARLQALQPVPPLHWLQLGQAALQRGETREALALLRRELRRQPEQHEVHFALARAYLQAGQPEQAQQHLAQAVAFSPNPGEQQRYSGKLALLRSALGGLPSP